MNRELVPFQAQPGCFQLQTATPEEAAAVFPVGSVSYWKALNHAAQLESNEYRSNAPRPSNLRYPFAENSRYAKASGKEFTVRNPYREGAAVSTLQISAAPRSTAHLS